MALPGPHRVVGCAALPGRRRERVGLRRHQRVVPGRAGAAAAPAVWSSAVYAGVGTGIALAGLVLPGRRRARLVGRTRCGCSWARWRSCCTLPVLWVLLRLRPAASGRRGVVRRGAPARSGTTGAWSSAMASFGLRLHPAGHLPAGAGAHASSTTRGCSAWPGRSSASPPRCPRCSLAGWPAATRRGCRSGGGARGDGRGRAAAQPVADRAGPSRLSALLVGGTFMVVTLAGVQEIRAARRRRRHPHGRAA